MDPALVDPAPLALFECGPLGEAEALALARPIASDAGLSLVADDGVAGEESYTLQFVGGDANIFISKAEPWDGPQLGAFPTERPDRRVLATLDRLADALDCRLLSRLD